MTVEYSFNYFIKIYGKEKRRYFCSFPVILFQWFFIGTKARNDTYKQPIRVRERINSQTINNAF